MRYDPNFALIFFRPTAYSSASVESLTEVLLGLPAYKTSAFTQPQREPLNPSPG
jgi:hypothetical protein